MELRCHSRIHGIIKDGQLEVKCASGHCRTESGVTVLHYFDLVSGELVTTRKFRDPKKLFESNQERTS